MTERVLVRVIGMVELFVDFFMYFVSRYIFLGVFCVFVLV